MTTAAAPSPLGRSQRLWAVLLVVDSFFVIIFGGALAAKIYQHWQAPSSAVAASRQRRQPKPAPPPKIEQAAEAPAPPAAKPAPAPPSAAAKPAEPAHNSPRPPKPSLLQSAPQREAAKPHGAATSTASAAPAAAAASAKSKALATDFSLKFPGAHTVELAGAFIVRGGKKAMVSHPDGTWTLTLYLTPDTYRYWFLVNGKKTLDPQNSQTERGASVIVVGQ